MGFNENEMGFDVDVTGDIMKKSLLICLSLIIVLSMVFGLTACNKNADKVEAFDLAAAQGQSFEGVRGVVLLGNKLNDDGSFTEYMNIRMELALELYDKAQPDYIILSGGVANKKAGVSEAKAMYDYLSAHGIPADILIIEDKSMTTKQNAKFSVPLAEDLGINELIVCTSSEHMFRKRLNPRALFYNKCKDTNIKLFYYTDTE